MLGTLAVPATVPALPSKEERPMLRWAVVFLIVALIAGFLGLYHVSDLASNIAWILFVIFLVLFVVSLVFGGVRRPPV
jgi:uncharacterized membrane protein YtjA (UPF0391 family)